MRRFINLTLAFLTILVVVLGLLNKWLGRRVTDRVVAELQNVYGGRVGVQDVHIGVNGTTLHGLELFEQDDPNGKPWLQVDKLHANVTLADAARGQVTPTEVNLDGAAITLRFNKEGNLLTRWPMPGGPGGDFKLPRLVLRDGRVRLRREDGSELLLQHVNARLERDEDNHRMVLRGDFGEDHWGRWTIAGTRSDDGRLDVNLSSAGSLRVTPVMLGQLPFVPENTWREVTVSGETTAKITVHADPEQPLHYRIDLAPQHTHLHLRALDLDVEDADGRVVIDDGLVRLRGVKGLIAGGRVATEADFDFREAVTHFDFTQLRIEGLEVQQLPLSWKLPRTVRGLFEAQLSLHVDINNGQPRIHGAGTGQLRSLNFAGLPIEDSIRLTLRDRSADPQQSAALLVNVQVKQLDLAELLARLQNGPRSNCPANWRRLGSWSCRWIPSPIRVPTRLLALWKSRAPGWKRSRWIGCERTSRCSRATCGCMGSMAKARSSTWRARLRWGWCRRAICGWTWRYGTWTWRY